ncbi:type I-MYXAN CRISPR-associated protein Cas6/Cmx6, partial [Nostoc sp. NIES-2111]
SESSSKPRELLMSQFPYMDLTFSLIGETLPFDHGYKLFSTIAHFEHELHKLDTVGIHTIAGIPKDGVIHLTQNSRLRIRIPVNQVRLVYPLAGKSLRIGKHSIRLGIPDICLLQPAEQLRSRIVIIRGYAEPEGFLTVAKHQLEKLGIQGMATIQQKADGRAKHRTIKVHNSTLVGFSLNVTNLSDEDSLLLQMYGIGGKRKMGCGLFVPMQEQLTNN